MKQSLKFKSNNYTYIHRDTFSKFQNKKISTDLKKMNYECMSRGTSFLYYEEKD